MNRIAIAALALALAGPAAAQLRPDTPSMLTWNQEQRERWFRAIETVYAVREIKAGGKVRPLPVARRQIDPRWSKDGRAWTLDQYMAAYKVSGVIVLKDGEIVLERYALG